MLHQKSNMMSIHIHIYEEMKRNIPQSVSDYYDKNWHTIRNESVLGFTFNNQNFTNKTNKKLENLIKN